MRKFNVNVNGISYQVEVEEIGASVATVAPAPVKKEAAKVAAVPTPVIAGSGSPLKAPMPGVIKDFKVKDGDKVKVGQPVMIIEAMKMENDIAADKDGVITLAVAKEASVNTGDIIAYIA